MLRPSFLALASVVLVLAGCGGDSGSGDAAKVEDAVVAQGDVQNISCDALGTEEVGGVEQPVFMCSFEEESDPSGNMRDANRCFVLQDDGTVTDVTADLRDRGSCPVTSP